MTPDMGCERERRESRGLETPKAGPRPAEKEGRREGEGKEEGKAGGTKRHATRSTPSTSCWLLLQ